MNFKKVILGSIVTTAAAGTLFASQLQVAEAVAYETPVDASGNVILGGAPDVNPADKSAVSSQNEAKSEAVQKLEKQNAGEGFKTKAEAEEAAKKVLKEDKVNKSYTVSQGANSNYYFTVSPNEAEKPADNQAKETSVEALKEHNAGEGFKTQAEAEDAAKKVLAKDEVNKSFTVSQGANSNYYFALSPSEAEETKQENKSDANTSNPSEDKVEPKSEDKKEPVSPSVKDPEEQNLADGFKTKVEAEEAAQKVLKNDKINKSYTVSQGTNGNYYYLLSPNEAATAGQGKQKVNTAVGKKVDKPEAKPSVGKKANKTEAKPSVNKQNAQTEVKKSAKEVAADKQVAAKKSDAVKSNGKQAAANKAKSTLPKTGAITSVAPTVIGLALASLGSVFAFAKKKADK